MKNYTDADLHTIYLGDSVYVAEFPNDTGSIILFLNNGERDASNGNIFRKSPIILDAEIQQRLVKYIKREIV